NRGIAGDAEGERENDRCREGRRAPDQAEGEACVAEKCVDDPFPARRPDVFTDDREIARVDPRATPCCRGGNALRFVVLGRGIDERLQLAIDLALVVASPHQGAYTQPRRAEPASHLVWLE